MRLKKGSKRYLLGILFLLISSVMALISWIICLVKKGDMTVENRYLSTFGARITGTGTGIIISGVLFVAGLVSVAILFLAALKHNSFSKQFVMIGAVLILLSAALAAHFAASAGDCGWTVAIWGILLRCIPLMGLGIGMILMRKGNPTSRIWVIVFGIISGITSFTCLGFEKLFTVDFEGTSGAVMAYVALFILSISVCLYFLGICFCAGSCEKRPENQCKLIR